MYADLERITLGSHQADTAADHVRMAGEHLRSVEVIMNVFGLTEVAANAANALSRAHEQHLYALDEHHRNLTRIAGDTATIAAALGETDRTSAESFQRITI